MMSFSALSLAALLAGPAVFAQGTAPWKGFQAGVQVGYSTIDINRHYTNTFDGSSTTREVAANGADYGVFAGYMLPVGVLCLGLEADATLGGAEESAENDASELTRLGFKRSHGLGARIGYAMTPGTLLYLRFGWEATKGEFHQQDLSGVPSSARAAKTLNGTRFGLGADVTLSPRLFLRLDWSWIRYGRLDAREVFEGTDIEWARWTMKPASSRFRLAAGYRF